LTTATISAIPPTATVSPADPVLPGDVVTVTGAWSRPVNPRVPTYEWTWDLDGDGTPDDGGTAGRDEPVVRPTSFPRAGTYQLTFAVNYLGVAS